MEISKILPYLKETLQSNYNTTSKHDPLAKTTAIFAVSWRLLFFAERVMV